MTKIRLARIGSKHNPHYRIVVSDSRSRRDGRFIETLGSYDPLTHPSTVTVNKERADYWISTGAQATNTVISLLTRSSVTHPFVVRRKPFKKAEATAKTPNKEEAAEAPDVVEENPLSDEAAQAQSEVAPDALAETSDTSLDKDPVEIDSTPSADDDQTVTTPEANDTSSASK